MKSAQPLWSTAVPTLTLFCGLPGSGKSTVARRLEAQGGGVRLCTDEWQGNLGISHSDAGLHDRLQALLRRHGLALLSLGVSVILEDGLWMTTERTQAFSEARSRGARIDLQVFDVPLEMLLDRLHRRNQRADPAAYPITCAELRWAWNLFEPPSADELKMVDSYEVHTGEEHQADSI